MLQKLRNRINEEKGFTLIELLVVILIIGILAAIALPVFLGQQEKGQDSSAKADVRNAYSQLEACYADTQNYKTCTDTPATYLPSSKTGFSFSASDSVAGDNSIKVVAAAQNTFTLEKKSASGGLFQISKSATGPSRACSGGTAGCSASKW